jgi:hypothetical protein
MGPKRNSSVLRGAVKQYLATNFTHRGEINTLCKNGHVILLFINNGESIVKSCQQVNSLFSIQTGKYQIFNVINTSKKWACNYSRDSKHFIEFCNEPFLFHNPVLPMMQTIHSNQSSSFDPAPVSSVEPTDEHINTLPLVNRLPFTSKNSIENAARRHTSREELTPWKEKLSNRLSYLSNQLANSKNNHRKSISKVKSTYYSNSYKLKVFRQNIKRKEDIIKVLRTNTYRKFCGLQIRTASFVACK